MSAITSTSKLSRLQNLVSADTEKSVLVVDASHSTRDLLCSYLRAVGGFTIESTGSLAEALALVGHDSQRFFCAALDHNLPDSPNGEIVDALLNLGIPVIVMGTADDTVRRRLLKQDIVDYIVKDSSQQIEHVAYLIGRLRENRAKKILVVDGSSSFRAYIVGLLQRYFYSTFQAGDGEEALTVLAEHPDLALVITDVSMPRMDGFTLINEIRKRYRREDLAIIGVSETWSAGLSAKTIKAGGNDFVPKSFEAEEFYCRVTQNTNMIGYVRQIHHTASRDFLTGVFNRRYLFEIGETLHANAKRGNILIAASIIDADHFKKINDTYGHQVGDEALKGIAKKLLESFRKTDVVARYGGEEFVCLAVVKDPSDAGPVFERVRAELASVTVKSGDETVSVTVSIGVTTTLGASLEEMLKRADDAVYAAKRLGRNRVVEL